MAFFHKYPYDSAHELNLDWIIKTVESVNQKVENVLESYGQPVIVYQKSLMNDTSKIYLYEGIEPDMQTGHWYFFNELTSEWVDGGPYGGNVEYKTVNNYYQSGSNGGSIVPIYLGDSLVDNTLLPSCCIKVENYIYLLSAYNNTANTGILQVFDVDNNAKVGSDSEILMGHANSIAHTPDGSFWVVPIWNRSSGSPVEWPVIIKYNDDWSTYDLIVTPTTAKAVSYDSVSGVLYYNDYNGRLYKLESDGFTWTESYIISVSDLATYNQDFAIRDGHVFLSIPRGFIAEGEIPKDSDDAIPVIDVFSVRNVYQRDFTGRWRLGELQGMEFDADGHLLAVEYVGLNGYSQGFIVELPVMDITPYTWVPVVYTRTNFTATLSEDTQSHFYLRDNELRSLAQLIIDGNHQIVTQVDIVGNVVESKPLRLTSSIVLRIFASTGNFTFDSIRIDNGSLTFDCEAAKTISSSAVPFSITRNGEIHFLGSADLTISLQTGITNCITFGAAWSPLILIHRLPLVSTGTFRINTTTISTTGVYFGTTKL